MLSIRNAVMEDREIVFEWRNDAITRKMFRNSDLVSWEHHCEWFSKVMNSNENCLLICGCKNKLPVGVIRFDVKGSSASVSINLSPTARGKGFGAKCLALAIDHFKTRHRKVLTLFAEIKIFNVASLKTFEKIGFTLIDENDGFLCLSLELKN